MQRKLLRIVAIVAVPVFGGQALASTGDGQTLKRPVDAQMPSAEISLAELASKVSPGRDAAGQPTRVYTNADLNVRPAPIPPKTPPFPEIAPPTGILEHAGKPEVQQRESPQDVQGANWNFTAGVALIASSPGRLHRSNGINRVSKPIAEPLNRPFDPVFGLRSASLPPPLGSGPDLFLVGRGGRSLNHSPARDRTAPGRPRPQMTQTTQTRSPRRDR